MPKKKEKALPKKLDANVKARRKQKTGYLSIIREEAFALYKKLGSVKKVSEIPSMPDYKTLLRWKEEDKWDERIEKAKESLQKWESVLARLETDSIVKDDVAHLMLLNFIFEKAVKAIISKDLEPATWKEALDTFKMVFEQKRLLMGRPGSKAEFSIDFSSMDESEVRETIKKINELLGSVASPHSPEEKVKEMIQQKVDLEEQLELSPPEGSEIIDTEPIEDIEEEVEPEIETKDDFDSFLKEIAGED